MRSTCSALRISSGAQRMASRGSGASEGPMLRGARVRSRRRGGGGGFGHGLKSAAEIEELSDATESRCACRIGILGAQAAAAAHAPRGASRIVACAVQSRLRNSERRGCALDARPFSTAAAAGGVLSDRRRARAAELLGPPKSSACVPGSMQNLAHPSPRAKVASSPEDPGWFLEDFCCWQENAALPAFHLLFSARGGSRRR